MKKFKILIIAYYYPPCNSVAANRPGSYAKNWAENGNDVHVITRFWSGKEKSWMDYISSTETYNLIKKIEKNITINYLPYRKKLHPKNKNISKIKSFYNYLIGNFLTDTSTLQFQQFAINYIQNNKFDFVIISSPPINSLKLGYNIKLISKIPLVIDIRDFENHYVLNKNPHYGLKSNYLHKLKLYYAFKWLKKSNVILTINDVFKDFFSLRLNQHIYTFTNGFDKDLFFEKEFMKNKRFTVSVIGSIHPGQSIDFIIDGFNHFLIGKKSNKIIIQFIGALFFPEVGSLFLERIKSEFINVSGRIPKNDAINYMKNSDVLFYPGLIGRKGVYSGKIFEYLASRKNILIAPNDHDVLEKLIIETNSGKLAESPTEMANHLNKWYNEWETKGILKYNGIDIEIEKFRTDIQAKEMLLKIEEVISN